MFQARSFFAAIAWPPVFFADLRGQLVEVRGAEGVMAPAGRGWGGSAESLR